MRCEIRGQHALVTGAARGIGRAIAEALVDEGASVVLCDVDEVALRGAVQELEGRGSVRSVVLDVRDAEAFRAVVEGEVAAGRPVDILVNNAGIMPLCDFLQQGPLVDERTIEVNLMGVLHGMRAALPGMVARGHGTVVNVASAAGKVSVPGAAVYSATKHAVVGLTAGVGRELEGAGVHLMAVLPSIVATELTAGTGRVLWPPTATPDDVAMRTLRGIRRRKLEVYVPRAARLSAVLPALLPRRVLEWVGRRLGVDRVLRDVDHQARASYVARTTGDLAKEGPQG